jgi:hypothetical protein
MSILPMKASSLSVKNSLSAEKAYIKELSIYNRGERKYTNLLEIIDTKLKSVSEMEGKLTDMIVEFNKAVEEIKTIKNTTTTRSDPEPAKQGPPGPPGESIVGPPGPPGKIGPRGLKGARCDLPNLSSISDVDVKGIKDGDALIWNAIDGKWKVQSIFDE